MICPLCSHSPVSSYHSDRQREFLYCLNCHLVFVPPQYHLSLEEEKAEYDLHQNSPDDEGYKRFLSRLADPLASRLEPSAMGLDFGCGPGPTLSSMLAEKGYEVAIYDPFYFPDPSIFSQSFAFITLTEVVEHFREPAKEFNLLFPMVEPGGFIGIMTKLVKNRERFSRWHYIRDRTHLCFYHQRTFLYLAAQHNAVVEYFERDVIILRKKPLTPP